MKALQERGVERVDRIHVEVVENARHDDPPHRRQPQHGDETRFVVPFPAVVTTRPYPSAPRTGSGIRSAMIARITPGTQANKNAARQPNLVAMAPALM